MLRKPSVTLAALRGPNEWRAAADSGQLVIRLEDLSRKGDAQWDFLAYVRHQPLRPVLLRMIEEASSPIPKMGWYVCRWRGALFAATLCAFRRQRLVEFISRVFGVSVCLSSALPAYLFPSRTRGRVE